MHLSSITPAIALNLPLVCIAGLCASLSAHAQVSDQLDQLHYVQFPAGSAASSAHPILSGSISTPEQLAEPITTVTVFPNQVLQESLAGIGGAFNEQGGEAFMSLPSEARQDLAEALFNPESGAGLSFCRTAIGSSDFGLGAYSYSEVPEDYEMEHFSIELDTSSVIPFIQAAQAQNEDLKIFASPWSPPGWMKVNGRMDTVDASPVRVRNPNDPNNVLKADPKVYDAYALYFSKYVQAYAAHGIDISRIIVQNETDMNPIYPGCNMLPDQMAELIKNHIRPRFEEDELSTEIWAGSFRGVKQKGARNDAAVIMTLPGAEDLYGS